MHVAIIFTAQLKLTFEDCNPQGLSAILTVWMLDWNCGKSCEYCRDNHLCKLIYCCDSVLRLEVDIVMISISYASKTKSLLSSTFEDLRFEEPKTLSIFCMELHYVQYFRDLHWPQTSNGNRKGSGIGIRHHWRVNDTNLKSLEQSTIYFYFCSSFLHRYL